MIRQFRYFLPALILLAIASSRGVFAADGNDSVAQTLGLTPESKSLPMWTKPAQQDVQQITTAVRSFQPSIVLVGHPKVGLGTAWVLSKKNRLLATNAHVADIRHDAGGIMFAIPNGTSTLYTIDKVWYHPGVMREVISGMSIRQSDPENGEVDPWSPDVAVLHVAEGQELPDELKLATPDELDCFAQSVGMLGFPGHDTSHWPGLGEKVAGTFREGVISRLSDFHGNVNTSANELQFIQHSMNSWFGFSGSPIFLPNGHVVALNNSGRSEKKGSMTVQLAYGVRVDCLWELLAYHHLDKLVSVPIKTADLNLDRFSRPDPEYENYYKAQVLLDEGQRQLSYRKFKEAAEKCNEAIKLAPYYAAAYATRAAIYNNYGTDELYNANGRPDTPEQYSYAKLAMADYQKALKLAPSEPKYYVNICVGRLNLGECRFGKTF